MKYVQGPTLFHIHFSRTFPGFFKVKMIRFSRTVICGKICISLRFPGNFELFP